MIPDINLMPKLDKRDSISNGIYLLFGVLAVIGLVILIWLYISANATLDDLTVEHTALQATHSERTAELQTLQAMNNDSLAESVSFVERVSYPVTPLIEETQDLLPDNTYLRQYAFSETTVTATMDFETLNAVSTYLSRLEKSPYFVDVQVGAVSNFELAPDGETQSNDDIKFNEVPRYSVEVTLTNDVVYTAGGGSE